MHKIAIVAIGNELLKGATVNTNASEISRALHEAGFKVSGHAVIPDDPKELKSTLESCLRESDIVITTGGLGPTCDDTTRQVAAELYDSGFHYNEALAQDLIRRYGKAPIALENQATVPSKAQLLNNPVGTAPGFIFRNSISTLILMPGVPREMRAMLKNELIPYLTKHFSVQKQAVKTLHFFNLSESSIDPYLRQVQSDFPQVEPGIYPSHGLIAVTLTAAPERALEVTQAASALAEHFAEHLYEAASGKIEEAVQNLFVQQKWTLALAESCTGGGVAARLTKLPGASQYFLGGVVCYSDQLKKAFLNVPALLLQEKGAVSQETVLAMLAGILDTTGCDVGMAISGIAGPSGGSSEKPVGTVWIAIGMRGSEPFVTKILAKGNREMIIERAINAALAEVLKYAKAQM